MRTRNRLFYGWVVVLACFGINAAVHGIRYSFGVFFKSLGSEFDLNRTFTSGVTGLYWILCAAFAVLGGLLLDKYGPRKMVVPMGIITGLSLVATSRTNDSWQLFLTYSLCLAAGTGGMYTVLMTTAQRWFATRRGTVVGIVGSGVGVGTIIMTPLTAYLIGLVGWRTTYLAAGLALGALIVILAIPLRRGPATVLPANTQKPNFAAETEVNQARPPDHSHSLSSALRTRNFWLIAIIWVLWAFSLLLVVTHLVPHMTDLGIASTTAAFVSGLIGVVSIFGRLGMGWICDRLERRTSIVITVLMQAAPLFLLVWAQSLWAFYLFAIVFALGYGGLDPATIALVSDSFGVRNLSKILGVLTSGWTLGAGAGAAVGGILFDATGSYFAAFLLVACLMLAVTACALLIERPGTI